MKFMKILTVPLAALALAPWCSAAAADAVTGATVQADDVTTGHQVEETTPRYIFFCIGDGMGMGQVMVADAYNRLLAGDSARLAMQSMPVASQQITRSASSDVTDSAAAGTALATGHKTRNSMLGMDADTVAVTSIAKTLYDNGYGIGLVTTVAPDDATPGAFYAHVPNRGMYYEIGRQAAESGYHYIAGSQWRGAKDKNTGEDTGLYELFGSYGVAHVQSIAQADSLSEAGQQRIFVTSPHPFNDSNVGFTIDSIPGMMTLSQMTGSCLKHLQRVSPDRFFMMIEGGNIDHAGHANDGAAVAVETLAFDAVIAEVMEFYRRHPDETLIVVTADHETGGLSVGNSTTHYAANYRYVPYQRVSKSAFDEYVKSVLNSRRTYHWEDMREYLEDTLGLWRAVPVTDAETAQLEEWFRRIFIERELIDGQETLYGYYNPFTAEVFKLYNNKAGYGWTTLDHSGNPVPVYAIGAGAGRFARLNDNTDIPARIMGHNIK